VKGVVCREERGRRAAFTGVLPLTHLRARRSSVKGRRAPAVGAMLKQEELVFIKAISIIEVFPAFLRELRKAVVVEKK
jgi:hypothetical protein